MAQTIVCGIYLRMVETTHPRGAGSDGADRNNWRSTHAVNSFKESREFSSGFVWIENENAKGEDQDS